MAPKCHFILFLTILLLANVSSPSMVSASPKLVAKVCNGKTIKDHDFCLKALANPKTEAAKNLKQLTNAIMKLASSNAQSTLNAIVEMTKKPTSPGTLKALKDCEEVYRYAVRSFGMIPQELKEDAMSANYDVSVIGPEVDRCVKALAVAHVDAPQIVDGNNHLQSFSAIGNAITASLE